MKVVVRSTPLPSGLGSANVVVKVAQPAVDSPPAFEMVVGAHPVRRIEGDEASELRCRWAGAEFIERRRTGQAPRARRCRQRFFGPPRDVGHTLEDGHFHVGHAS